MYIVEGLYQSGWREFGRFENASAAMNNAYLFSNCGSYRVVKYDESGVLRVYYNTHGQIFQRPIDGAIKRRAKSELSWQKCGF